MNKKLVGIFSLLSILLGLGVWGKNAVRIRLNKHKKEIISDLRNYEYECVDNLKKFEVIIQFFLKDGHCLLEENSLEDIPDTLRFSNYYSVRSNPAFVKWVVDNHWMWDQKNIASNDICEIFSVIQKRTLSEQILRNKRFLNNFLNAFLNKQKIQTIPHIHHRMWITSHENPVEVTDTVLEYYLESLENFSPDWKHVFWCLDPLKIPKTIEKLKASKIPIEIRSIAPLLEQMPGKSLFESLHKEKHYAIASDILRRFVIYKEGGLYCDMGVLWKKDPTFFVDIFDRVLNFTGLGPDFAIYAAPSNHIVEKKLFIVLEDFQKLSSENRKKFSGQRIHTDLLWGSFTKLLIEAESPENDRIFYWDQYEEYFRSWRHYGSWIHGRMGSNMIKNSKTNW